MELQISALLSLKMKSRIRPSDYSEFESLIKHIKNYRVRHKLFKKWYLKLWWVTEKAECWIMHLDFILL